MYAYSIISNADPLEHPDLVWTYLANTGLGKSTSGKILDDGRIVVFHKLIEDENDPDRVSFEDWKEKIEDIALEEGHTVDEVNVKDEVETW